MAAEFQLHNQQEVAVESVRKNTSVTGHFWEDCGTESRKEKETLTLQEAFEKFRKKRQVLPAPHHIP